MTKRKARRQSVSNSPRINQTLPNESVQTRSGAEIPALKVPAPFQGFIDFVREQGVVGLGVGFVIGTAANTLIKSAVTNLLNPIIGLATGGIDLSQKTACLNSVNGVCKNALSYGQVISDLITFLAIVVVVYFVVKGMRLEKLDKPKVSK